MQFYKISDEIPQQQFTNEEDTLTVPHKSMSVRQVYNRYASGAPLPPMVHDNTDYDPDDMPEDYIPLDRRADFEMEDVPMDDTVPSYTVTKQVPVRNEEPSANPPKAADDNLQSDDNAKTDE